MKHSVKRLLSLLLALIFCVGLFPATALAEEPKGEIAPVEDPAPAPDQGDDPAPGGIIGLPSDETVEPDDPANDPEALPPEDGADEPAEVVASGTCGDDLTWTLDDAGLLTISGTGPMTSYSSGGAPWYSYRSKITYVKISGATRISNYAFYYCNKISTVDYGSDVTVIGNYAFGYCSSLTSIAIPDAVTALGAYAYYANSAATSVSIPASLRSIGSEAFTNCWKVTSYTVDAGNTAFCSQNGVMFNKNMTSLLHYPAGSSRTSYTVPSTVTSIGSRSFAQAANLTRVDLSQAVTIKANAFLNCTGLNSVTIPASVTSLDDNAFAKCLNLSVIHFLGNAPTISDTAFTSVSARAFFPPDNSTWTSEVQQNYGGTISWSEEQNYPIWIDGVQVTSLNMDDVLGNGVFRYNGSTDIYVNGNYTGSSPVLIEFQQYYASLVVTGNYTLRNASTASDAALVRCSGRLTIDGGGRLTLRGNGGENSYGIQTETGGFLLYTGCLEIYNVAYGIRCTGSSSATAKFTEADVMINANELAVSGYKGGVTLTDCVYANPAYATVDNGSVGVANIRTDGFTACKYLEISTRGYDLIINGIRVTEDNRGDVWGGGEFYYNPGTDTLSLYGSFDATDTWGAWDYVRDQPIIDNSIDGLTILLTGDVTLTCALENYQNFTPAIRSNGDLTILGTSGMDHPVLTLRNSPSGGGSYDGVHMVHGALVLENLDLRINVLGRSLFGHGLVGLNDDCSVAFRSTKAQILCDDNGADITSAALTGFPGGVRFEECGTLYASIIITDGAAYQDGALSKSLDLVTDVYDLFIGGERVYDGYLERFWCAYDPAANTLTVNLGSSYSSATFPLIDNHIPGLTVYVEKTTKLSSSGSGLSGLITSDADMTIRSAPLGESVACLTLNHSGLVGSGISMKNGAVLTLDRTRLVMNSGLLGSDASSLRIVDSSLEVNQTLNWGIYGFTGGITLIGCTLREPENGIIRGGAIYEADGSTVASSVKILTDDYDLWIAGQWVNAGNKADVLGDGTFSYDSASNTLTIHKSFASGDYNALITNKIPGLTIAVPSDVTLTSAWGEEGSCLINSETALTITGPGKLTLHGCGLANSIGVSVKGENEALILREADVVVENVAYGVSGAANIRQSLRADHSKLAATASAAAVTGFTAGLTLSECEVIFPANYRMDADGTLCDSSGTPAPFARIGTDYFRTVTFDVQGHGTAPEPQSVPHGSCISEPTAPSEEGWLFDGWYTDAACASAYDFSTPVVSNITLYAKWIKLYELWISGIQVNAENKDDIWGDGTASYDPDTRTLTFTRDPANLFYRRVDVGDVQFYALIWSKDDLTIQTPGSLTLQELVPLGTEDNVRSVVIYVENGSLTINGDFIVESSYKSAVNAMKSILINGSVQIRMNSNAATESSALVNGSGGVHITGDLYASMYRGCAVSSNNGDIRIDGSVTVHNYLDGGVGLYTRIGGSLIIGDGAWDIDADRAIDVKDSFGIPASHVINTPVGGMIVQLNDGLRSYYTVTEADGATEANHVVIKPRTLGDINMDGSVNALDLLVLRKYLVALPIVGAFDETAADLNGDGTIDILDLVRLRKVLADLGVT